MIRRSLLVVAAVCALAGSAASARQSVDDLIAKNLEAKGGLEKLKAIQSIKQVNSFNMQGMEGSMTIFTKRPNRLRQEMTMGGQTVINGFDGVTPWTVNPLVGMNRAVAVTGPQADMVREQGDFDGPLVDYKAKGYTIELVGQETLGERKVHHLRMTSASRQVVHLYLDARHRPRSEADDGGGHAQARAGVQRLPHHRRRDPPVPRPVAHQRSPAERVHGQVGRVQRADGRRDLPDAEGSIASVRSVKASVYSVFWFMMRA